MEGFKVDIVKRENEILSVEVKQASIELSYKGDYRRVDCAKDFLRFLRSLWRRIII